MSYRVSKIFLITAAVLFGFFLIFQPIANVHADAGLVQCGRLQDDPSTTDINEMRICTVCDTLVLASRVINFVLFTLVPAIAVLLYLIAGFLILLGGANPGWVATGTSIFKTTTWGVVIIFASWMITNSVLKSIAGNSLFTKDWNKVVCVEAAPQPPPSTQRYACGSQGCVANATGQFENLAACQSQCAPAASPTPTTSPTAGPTPTATPTNLPLSITTTSLSDAAVGQQYAQPINATGGVTPYTWTRTAGSLPAGLSLSANGIITGTPTAVANNTSYTFEIKVQDSTTPTKQSATKSLSIRVLPSSAALIISNVAVSGITQNSATITWTTDKPSTSQVEYGPTSTFGSAAPTPANASLVTNHSVRLTGLTPNTTYSYRAKSSIPTFNAVSATYNDLRTLAGAAPLSISTASLPDGAIGQSYNQNLQANGGTTPYAWTRTVGNLPPGLSLSAAGVITGSPTTAGLNNFTVKVEDSSNPKQSATKSLSIRVAATAVVISNVAHSSITTNGAAITWTTDRQATSQVEYSISSTFSPGTSTTISSTPKTSHSVALTGLTPNTTYYYRAKSSITGYTAVSSAYSFRTLAVVVSPTPSSSPSPTITSTPSPSPLACMFNGVNYSTLNLCSGQRRPGGCGGPTCAQYSDSINRYASGAATAQLLKTMMVIESDCNIRAGTSSSYGLMQIRPATANQFRSRCGVTENITAAWLTNPANADKSICIGAAFVNSIAAGACGSTPAGIYAGYNAGPGNCRDSSSCAGQQSCRGGPMQMWECPYDTAPGGNRICNTGFYETKQGATYVNYCMNNLGF